MEDQTAYNVDLTEVKTGVYDEALHARFVLWRDQSGRGVNTIAGMINRSGTAISQYINKKYPGDVAGLERDILSLLRREEDLQFTAGPSRFCTTTASTLIYEVLQYCDQKQKMGAALAPSGTGKTETCKQYKRDNRATVFVTADVTTRSPAAIMRRLIEQVGGVGRRHSISEFLQALIDKLKNSKRLIIIDDGHFLKWEAFELIRKIHDCARVGVVYVGQETLYEQMKGDSDKNFLFDQIYSRIAIKRDKFQVLRKDAAAIVNSLCSGLDRECLDFLYARARGKGRYRYMTNLLDVAMEMHKGYSKPMGVPLLQEAERFLVGG